MRRSGTTLTSQLRAEWDLHTRQSGRANILVGAGLAYEAQWDKHLRCMRQDYDPRWSRG